MQIERAAPSSPASLPCVAIVDPSRGWLATIHPCDQIDGSAEAALKHLSRQNPGPAMQSAHTLMLAALRLARHRDGMPLPADDKPAYVVLRRLPADTELFPSEMMASSAAEELADSRPGEAFRIALLLDTHMRRPRHAG
ncbi:hypothetical protein [Pseudoroseomonas cervicalis]|uniref:hypothetical protein n=1 Tax=Teichococcus cervicalis TaxID=204525 RepID=UPI0027868A39|nr:hypothetical protein [Pseudoroseomonas cervicalis]MDQ1079717.1 hypothetical protein [Pseudoroseomonas cervicalis]